MKAPSAGFLVGVLSTAIVVFLAIPDAGSVAPGPLSREHASVDSLRGASGCVQCHSTREKSLEESCQVCHVDIETPAQAGRGLHAELEPSLASRCGRCHIEHYGAESPLVATRGFNLAGYETREDYDHAGLNYSLHGAHEKLSCAECHPNADLELLPAGEKRFLGQEPTCTACHEDPHSGKMAGGCADCHGQDVAFAIAPLFSHTSEFPLEGAHAGQLCQTCHESGSAYSIEFSSLESGVRSCQACHSSPHDEQFVARVAALEGIAADDCSLCHSTNRNGFESTHTELAGPQHAATGFALDVPHAELECAQCHAPSAATWEEKFPGRRADQCADCHVDPHAGQFLAPEDAGRDCLSCHDNHAFLPVAFGVEAHDPVYPLMGSHAAVSCQDCHPRTAGQARAFRGMASDCASCHGDPHPGIEPWPSDSCESCHDTTSFGEAAAGFDHGQWAGFVLAGAHRRTNCEACHVPSMESAKARRRLGFVEDAFGLGPWECATCHADPHGGAFSGPTPERVNILADEDATGCARCHNADAFSPTPFDHAAWTDHPLLGAHATLDCAACHTSGEAGYSSPGPVAGASCNACHEDPHRGQFITGGGNDCQRCHNESSFQELQFDHQRDARFALDDSHRRLDCSSCHVAWPLASGELVVRYRPLGRECGDCHDPGTGR